MVKFPLYKYFIFFKVISRYYNNQVKSEENKLRDDYMVEQLHIYYIFMIFIS